MAMRKKYKRYLFLFFSLAALLMGMSGTGVVFAQGHTQLASLQKTASLTCGAWSVVASPNGGSSFNVLTGVAAVSASDAWAVGNYLNSTDTEQTLIEHWDGTSWSIVASPNVGPDPNLLSGVAAVSTSDVWAVGYYYSTTSKERTLIEHWDGTSWSVVASPNFGVNVNQLSGVAAVSANDIWAVGNYYNRNTGITKNLTMNWNGTSWSLVPTPNAATNTNVLTGVAAVSASDIWAVGYYLNSTNTANRTLTMHLNGTKWSPVATPNVGTASNALLGVAAISTSDVWAVGDSVNRSTDTEQTLIEQWNGTSWSVVPSPNTASDTNLLYGVAAVSTSDVWAVGYHENNSTLQSGTLIEQWNGTSWSIVASPNAGSNNNALFGVTVSGSDVWAVGDYDNNSSGATQTLIEFYC